MNNQQFYDCLDATCKRLRQIGRDADADLLQHRLHHVSWATASELFNELEVVLRKILDRSDIAAMPRDLKEELQNHLKILEEG